MLSNPFDSLARALGAAGAFPPLMVHLVRGGEISGRLEQMLERVAQLETRTLERRPAVRLTWRDPLIVRAILLAIM